MSSNHSDSVSSPQPSAPPSTPTQVELSQCPNPHCKCPPPCPCVPPCTCGSFSASDMKKSRGYEPEPAEVHDEEYSHGWKPLRPTPPVSCPAEGSESCKLRKKGLYCLTHYVLPVLAGVAMIAGAVRLVRRYRS